MRSYIPIDDKVLRYWQVLPPKVGKVGRKRIRVRSANRGTPKPRKPIRVHHELIQ